MINNLIKLAYNMILCLYCDKACSCTNQAANEENQTDPYVEDHQYLVDPPNAAMMD
jgi:hypothetical protein